MTILHIIIAWLGLFVAYLIWARVRENKRSGRRFLDFGHFNFLLGSIGLSLVVWILITAIHPEPKFTTPDEEIKYGHDTRQPWITVEGLQKKIDSTPENVDLHFELLYNHFAQQDDDLAPPDPVAYNAEEEKLFTYYTDLSQSTDVLEHDIGHTMLAYFLISQVPADYNAASFHLQLVDNPTTRYVNFVAGKLMLFSGGLPEAEEHFFSEIRNKGYKAGAYQYLAVAYNADHNDSALLSIVYSGANEFIPDDIRARIYYQQRDVANFYSLKIGSLLKGINGWGLSGGIAILFIWLFFLWSLTFTSRIGVHKLMIPVLIGAVLAMSSWWLYAFYKNGLGFWMNGEVLNDLIFSFTGIGFIEELVKLIPFLIILRFTNMIRKPIDYIVVASACGLGFAVFENLMYISSYGLDVIHSRALTSSVSHMACSGIVAYGFVLRRYRWPSRWWLIPLFFILASGAHGFYDFWLLNEKVHSFGILTLFFFLSEILVYISFVNNALNQSVPEHHTGHAIEIDSHRITSVLAGALILLFAFEYLAICLVYGTNYGNASLLSAFLSGGYLIFFLSVRMAQIRIEPGKWERIEFLSGIFPAQMLRNRDEE